MINLISRSRSHTVVYKPLFSVGWSQNCGQHHPEEATHKRPTGNKMDTWTGFVDIGWYEMFWVQRYRYSLLIFQYVFIYHIMR